MPRPGVIDSFVVEVCVFVMVTDDDHTTIT